MLPSDSPIMMDSREQVGLPGKLVVSNGVNYYIHGLVHGNPLVSLTPGFKKEVNKNLKGLDVICEDGSSEWIEGAESFHEARYFGYNRVSISSMFLAAKSYLRNRFYYKSHQSPLSIRISEMTSISDLREIRLELFRDYSSEPTGMNFLLGQESCGTIDNIEGSPPNRIQRYLYEAKESVKYAQKRNLTDLHVVVGCSHELPLEYLLSNEEILHNYQF